MSHTPGPWIRDDRAGMACDVRAASGRKVALCWGLGNGDQFRKEYKDECDANARLIAAAPELLEMVTWLRDSHDQYLAHHGTRGTYLTPATRALIDAAIAKATGVPYDVTAD